MVKQFLICFLWMWLAAGTAFANRPADHLTQETHAHPNAETHAHPAAETRAHPNAETRTQLDAEIARLADQHNTPAAVAIWVQDGSMAYRLSHGYGSLQDREPIHPETSLMRIGSVAKPFTGLAALSLVDEGLLDLDADVNKWFDPPLIPETFDRPITLRHLLTHTPGFDDFSIGKSTRTREELPPLSESVRSLLPRRIAPPGEFVSYSNYGVLLAGYLVERAGGDGFNSVLRNRLFAPLQMIETTFDPEEEVPGRVVKGYFRVGGEFREVPFDYVKDGPAGQMLTTMADITRFMEFATAPGPLPDDQQALKERFLWASQIQHTHHPKFRDGMGFLWTIMEWNGHRVVAHDGGYPGLMARLMIFPGHNSAMFVFTNSMNPWFISDVTERMVDAFLPDAPPERPGQATPPQQVTAADTLALPYTAGAPDTAALSDAAGAHDTAALPDTAAPTHPPAFQVTGDPPVTAATEGAGHFDDGRSLRDFAGHFRDTRYSRDSMSKIAVMMGMVGEMSLWVTDDGYLGMPDHTGAARRLVRVDTLLFASIDDDYHMAFREEGGRITHVFTSGRTSLERISRWERASFQTLFLILALLVFIGIVLFYVIRLPVRVLRRQDARLGTVAMLVLSAAGIYVLQMLLLFIGGLSIPVYELFSGFAYGVPAVFYAANLLPWAALLLTLALVVTLVRSGRSIVSSFSPALFVLLSFVYLASLHYWNLCGWHF